MTNALAGIPSVPPDQFPVLPGLPLRPSEASGLPKQERNLQDVNAAKAIRRAEIERRCMELDPPIPPRVLIHMDSFQAALHISTPLTENAWAVLQPRLQAQRDVAEQKEHERAEQIKALEARAEERRQQELHLKEERALVDRTWDAMQAPFRDCLAAYADEIINQHWSGGASVSKDNCAKFAADVLLYARHRFYEDVRQEELSHSITSRAAHGHFGRDQRYPRTLSLENMKWLFDNKVKQITEPFQKELFLCHGCEMNFKFYGFDSIVQHYAAKHTTTLSNGNVVVDWRAEWPEFPPFRPIPTVMKSAAYSASVPVSVVGQGHHGVSSNVNSTDYRSAQTANGHENHHPTQPSLLTGYVPQSFNGVQGRTAPAYRFDPSYHGTALHHSAPMVSGPNYPVVVTDGKLGRELASVSVPASSMEHSIATAHGLVHQTQITRNAFSGEASNEQQSEMARYAREIWFGTSGIDDIPQSVRISVVIQHMNFRFEKKFAKEVPLEMFIDGLSTNVLMRPIKTLNGLACKACGTMSSQSTEYQATKLFSLLQLLNHFNAFHLATSDTSTQPRSEHCTIDWKRGMVELPEPHVIADLKNAHGMDESKLELLAWVFPDAFPDTDAKPNALDRHALLDQHERTSPCNGIRTLQNGYIIRGHQSTIWPVGCHQRP